MLSRSTRRLFLLFVAMLLGLVLAAVVYRWGMEALEGSPRTFWQSLEFASETLSTTGYGADSKWSHPAMVLFVVLLQVLGVFFAFLIIPAYLMPLLEERFEERLPRRAPPTLRDHVVIYRHDPAVEAILDSLAAAEIPSLVVESDEKVARELAEQRTPVVFTRVEQDALVAANVAVARAIVANGRDEENAAMILRARHMGFRGDVYALVADPVHRRPVELAGANVVYTPRHILAAALAARASVRITPRLEGIQGLDGRVEVRELRVQARGPLVGKTLAESGIEQGGVVVLGQWANGRLIAPAAPMMRLESRGLVVVLGTRSVLDQLAVEGAAPLRREGHCVVAGFGEVGRKVVELLTDVGERVRVIDRSPRPGVDLLVGDFLDPKVLAAADVAGAKAIVLALDRDDATLFATMILQDTPHDAAVIARVNHQRSVDDIYRAGADLALSISRVSGEMLSHRLLGREAHPIAEGLRVARMDARALAGRFADEAALRQRTSCLVAAVEREGELRTAGDWLARRRRRLGVRTGVERGGPARYGFFVPVSV